ncbi:MAG: hypothetical protein KC621_19870 [Myxococcales bacterium]|nr:hypothetical protein [Myxococcales bacterium]
MFVRALMVSCLLPLSSAFAGDGAHAALVGLGSAGGEVALGLGGAAVGLGIGASTCGGSFECWGPLIGAGVGLVSGATAGGLVGAGVTAQLTHERPARAVLGATVGLGAGVGLMVLGEATHEFGLTNAGIAVGALGMPLGGAIAVGTDNRVVVAPEARAGGAGLRVAGTF